MYTWDEPLKKHLVYDLIGTAFAALFGAIYEHFSHEVYSYFMIYAFAVPLCMGALPYSIMLLKGHSPGRAFLVLWDASIAAFTVGSVFKGVLDIYGTTNRLAAVYPITGAVLAVAALAAFLIGNRSEDTGAS